MEKNERGNEALLNRRMDRREAFGQLGKIGGMILGIRLGLLSKSAHARLDVTPNLPKKPERHWRLENEKEGVVHVWHPEYSGELKETIIFVKGDGCTVDRTWNRDHLADQFRSSSRKALFIAPETPIKGWERPFKQQWGGNLEGLLDFVKTETGVTPPDNITAIGHSAGYRTVSTWLDHESINTVILSDALYGRFKRYHQWADKEGNILMIVTPLKGSFTQKQTENFLKSYRRRNGKETVLESNGDIEHFDKKVIHPNHRVISLKSNYSHRGQVRKEGVIPLALKLTK